MFLMGQYEIDSYVTRSMFWYLTFIMYTFNPVISLRLDFFQNIPL